MRTKGERAGVSGRVESDGGVSFLLREPVHAAVDEVDSTDTHSEGDDGDLVRVTLAPIERPPTCAEVEHCVELDSLGDSEVYLTWELEAPEEDPGLFSVWINRPGETISAMVAGPVLKADPRTRPGHVTVEALRALVVDERLRLLVTPSVIAAGNQVRHWKQD